MKTCMSCGSAMSSEPAKQHNTEFQLWIDWTVTHTFPSGWRLRGYYPTVESARDEVATLTAYTGGFTDYRIVEVVTHK